MINQDFYAEQRQRTLAARQNADRFNKQMKVKFWTRIGLLAYAIVVLFHVINLVIKGI